MILIVEDDVFYAKSIVEMLQRLGYKAVFASTVDTALEIIKKQNKEIETIILDLMMIPGAKLSEMDVMDAKGGFETGFVLASLIRQTFPNITLICCSLTNPSRIRDSNLFDFILSKPISPHELENILKLMPKKEHIKGSDTFKLSPSVFGVGLDLRKLVKWLKQKNNR